MKEIQSRIEN